MSGNAPVVIEHVVRQTMVLIAQLATTGGSRAPLARVADQVFRDLTRALEEQGVRRKVVADMFGLALRSYQTKVQRLSASADDTNVSLWEAVYEFLRAEGVVTRAGLLRRFARDDPASVLGVAHDMVESGLLFRTGRGDGAVFRAADPEDLERSAEVEDAEARQAIVWAVIYNQGPLEKERLQELVRMPADALDHALEDALRAGRVQVLPGRAEETYAAATLVIPPGEAEGWEASLVDHYQSLVAAICTKLRNGKTRALPDDEVGGSTYHFDVWPGHPMEREVRHLLKRHREELTAVWERLRAHNAGAERAEEWQRVTFYFGQQIAHHGDDRPQENE